MSNFVDICCGIRLRSFGTSLLATCPEAEAEAEVKVTSNATPWDDTPEVRWEAPEVGDSNG
jgi:hypothetical protein